MGTLLTASLPPLIQGRAARSFTKESSFVAGVGEDRDEVIVRERAPRVRATRLDESTDFECCVGGSPNNAGLVRVQITAGSTFGNCMGTSEQMGCSGHRAG